MQCLLQKARNTPLKVFASDERSSLSQLSNKYGKKVLSLQGQMLKNFLSPYGELMIEIFCQWDRI
jgi:hypothetical protein